VLGRFGDQVQVRNAAGVVGWASAQDLLSADFWRQAQALDAKAQGLPVQARGHTRVLSNLHLEAGRDSPRIRQLNKDVPVDLLARQAVDVPTANAPTAAPKADSGPSDAPADNQGAEKKEDWWLINAHLPDKISQAGWILARFVDLDVPPPLPDYASAAGMHIVAWFELNHVADSSGAAKPQYLVVGTRGGEGQTCDFTSLRVFTWGNQKDRYETAFVDSSACGKLPVNLTRAKAAGGDVTFSFQDFSDGAPANRIYHVHQTVVRREREGKSPAKPKPKLKLKLKLTSNSKPRPKSKRK
jgi:hypothetical protein